MNKNIKIFLNYFLGPILFIWLTLSIYHQIKNQPHLDLSWLKIKYALNGEQHWMFWVVLFLMVVNWGIEARKWQVLLKSLESISWWKAFKATVAGVAFAINTPNRIGEYGGRVLYLQGRNRIRAVSLTLVGSISQFLVTLMAGCGGLIFLLNISESSPTLPKSGPYFLWIKVILCLISVASILGLMVYFRLAWLVKIIDKIPAFYKLATHISVVEDLSFAILLRVLSLSFFRYGVFVIQYILMLKLMQVEVTVWQAFWLVSVLFLVLAVVPTIALAEIGIRGKISLELFGLFSINNIGIISASVGIWFINLVIPALLGSILILRIKIFKNK
ncbi:MAG: lysylphosphatidylglycerol synthase domain-containing protein [Chitinophagaceae bacterium]